MMKYTNEAISKRKKRKNRIKKTIIIIIYTLLLPMLVYNTSLIIQAIAKPNQTPSFFGIKMYVIISGSMKPELQIGDVVIVKETEIADLQKGDIISFRKGQNVVTHRITEVTTDENETKFKTKGDNNNIEDIEIITKKNIEGKVISKISSIGNIVLVLKDKTVIIAIILFYYIFLLRDQSVQKRKAIRRMKREEYETKKHEEN